MAMVQEQAMSPSPDPVTQTLDTSSGPPPSAEQVSQVANRHMDTATYRDLVIFEERLRGNMRRLQRRKKKYEAILVLFVVLIAYFSYAVFIHPSSISLLVIFNKICLFGVVMLSFLFFWSGMYREKIVYAAKFVPHCNKALRSFNLHFNRDGNGQLSFYKKIPKQFQEGFNAYRQHYYVRKKARKAAKAAGGQRQPASLSNTSFKQQQGQKLSVPADGTKAKST
ncbi:Spo7-like protein-domain-containing protein [Umbelopsis sp. PMI_123]|nr:Spo7-like protein-domain-containing protein [Umbelopsis sp. PMI_123]